MRASVLGCIGVAGVCAISAVYVATQPGVEPVAQPPAAAEPGPPRATDVNWPTLESRPPPTTGTREGEPSFPAGPAKPTSEVEQLQAGHDPRLRAARRASDGAYAEQRARALEAARGQAEIESTEDPPVEEPAIEDPLSDQMELEVPMETEPDPEPADTVEVAE